jgi:tetratricopeptide (TPR) repeat protein
MADGPESNPRAFIGRSDAVDQLRRRVDEARAGRGGLSLVVGEVGIGTSSLLRLVARECTDRGMAVLSARAGGLDLPPPLQLIRDALASGPAPRPDREPVGRSAPSLAAMVPPAPTSPVMIGFAGPAEGWSPGAATREDRLLDALGRSDGPSVDPRHKPFQTLARELRRSVDQGPTALLLEQLDRADEASLEFLSYIVPDLARHPLWIVGTSLPLAQIPEARRAWLERLKREAGIDEIALRPLTAQEVAEFVRPLLQGREADAGEIARWHAQSGGNPLFLERLARSALPPTATSSAGAVPTAEPADDAIRLLADLPPDESRILGIAAILGRSFPFPLLWATSGEEEERLAEEVEGLVIRGILREGVDETLEFLREELRSRVYSNLTATHRRLLHRKAGEALERTGAADVPTIYALALHCYLGRLDSQAALYNRMAGEIAVHQGSPTVARLHFERALEAHRRAHADDPLGEIELLLDLVVQFDRLGALEEADRLLTEAFDKPEFAEAASPAQRALARLYRARLRTDQGRWGEADRLTQELLQSADVRAGSRTLLRAHRLRGELLYYRGEYAEALRHHEEAHRIARLLKDPREIALETVRISNVLAMMPGRGDEAMAGYRLAAETLIELGDLGEAAYAQLFLGVVESQHGRVDAGLRELDKALTLAEEGHDPRRTGWARFNLADLERQRGEIGPARMHNAKALAILSGVGDRFGLLQVHIVEGKIRLAAGEPGAAEVALLEAYRLVRELSTPADEIEVLLRLIEVALALGDLPRARARLKEAERVGLARRPDLLEEWAAIRPRIPSEGDAAASGA